MNWSVLHVSLSFISFGLSFRRLRWFFESCSDLYGSIACSSLDCSAQFLEDNFNAEELHFGLSIVLHSRTLLFLYEHLRFQHSHFETLNSGTLVEEMLPTEPPSVFFSRLAQAKSLTNSIWSERNIRYINDDVLLLLLGEKISGVTCPVGQVIDWSTGAGSETFLDSWRSQSLTCWNLEYPHPLPWVASMVDQQTLRVPHQAATVYQCSYLYLQHLDVTN